MNRVIHVQDWVDHVLVTPSYDVADFRKFVGTSLWMAQPQYLREMQTWAFPRLHQRIVRSALRRFVLCDECLRPETVRCGPWIDYVLDEYAKATGITFGRKQKRTASEAAKVLGLEGELTIEIVQRAFRNAVLKAHPDLGGSAEAVQRVVEARDVLLEELK